MRPTMSRLGDRQVRRVEGDPRHRVEDQRHAQPDPRHVGGEEVVDGFLERRHDRRLRIERGRPLDRPDDRAVTRRRRRRGSSCLRGRSRSPAARPSPRLPYPLHMGADEKPYRVYRGGRTKGRVPLHAPRRTDGGGSVAAAGRQTSRSASGSCTCSAGSCCCSSLLARARGRLGRHELPRRSTTGSSAANDRVPEDVVSQLSKQDGLLSSKPTTILVMGTDGSVDRGAPGQQPLRLDHARSDTSRTSTASSSSRSRATSRWRSPASAPPRSTPPSRPAARPSRSARSKALTGLPVNHVVFVDFDRFRELIDAVGGIDVDVPRPIRSNRFDCPYDGEGVRLWEGWRFEKGKQHMSGRRALVYARIRENALDPGETDFTRSRRQQQVIAGGRRADHHARDGRPLPVDRVGDRRPARDRPRHEPGLSLGWAGFRADAGNERCTAASAARRRRSAASR